MSTIFRINPTGSNFTGSAPVILFTMAYTGPQGPQGDPGTPAAARKFAKYTCQITSTGPSYNLNVNEDFNNTGITFNIQYLHENNQSISISDDGELTDTGKFLINFIPPLEFNNQHHGINIFRAYDEPKNILIQAGEIPLDTDIFIIIEDLRDIFV